MQTTNAGRGARRSGGRLHVVGVAMAVLEGGPVCTRVSCPGEAPTTSGRTSARPGPGAEPRPPADAPVPARHQADGEGPGGMHARGGDTGRPADGRGETTSRTEPPWDTAVVSVYGGRPRSHGFHNAVRGGEPAADSSEGSPRGGGRASSPSPRREWRARRGGTLGRRAHPACPRPRQASARARERRGGGGYPSWHGRLPRGGRTGGTSR